MPNGSWLLRKVQAVQPGSALHLRLWRTREHILRDCPRYDIFRHRLTKAFPQLFLPTLLGTPAGITALFEFLATSGALSRSGQPAIPPEPPDLDDKPIPVESTMRPYSSFYFTSSAFAHQLYSIFLTSLFRSTILVIFSKLL
jgi:hypothetical protein